MDQKMERKPRTRFELDSPFMKNQWPEISTQHQDMILELLCNLLSPIGHHRHHQVASSEGKRSKKRKRKEAQVEGIPIPPVADIASYIVVGLNALVRALETLATASKPDVKGNEQEPDAKTEIGNVAKKSTELAPRPYPTSRFSMVFVATSLEMLQTHLPQLLATVSEIYPEYPGIRLVQLAKSSVSRLSEALGLPRVSIIGLLEGAPHSQGLVNYVREHVPEIQIPRISAALKPAYLPVRINAIETYTTTTPKKEAMKAA